jgi:ketose-bisphosphate aldolase
MALVDTKELFIDAEKGGYAVPALNANCLEMVLPLIEAAEAEASPLIIQFGKILFPQLSPALLAQVGCYAAKKARVPVAIHLDHGLDLDQAKECIEAGFTSIMYDGSSLSFEDNILRTREVVEFCAKKGIPVEGETGSVPISTDGTYGNASSDLTEPAEAVEYTEKTGVNSLAVAVGNLHRMHRKEAKIDFERIEDIHRVVKVPLVIHGSSGISPDDLRKAVACGIRKVNIATELNLVFMKGIRESLEAGNDKGHPMVPLKAGMDRVRDLARERIRVLNASGRY